MKLDSASVGGIILVSVGFIFILTCLDWLLMANFTFWKNPDLLYQYWTILGLIITMFSFALAYMTYIMKLPTRAVLAAFLTPILMFAGGLLDQVFAFFSFVQNVPYSFYPWSIQAKLIWVGWDWPEQIVWSAIFYGSLAYLWYRVLKQEYFIFSLVNLS
jgi:hypothetical protein